MDDTAATELVVSLDVGTAQVRCLVAETNGKGLRLLGSGRARSLGVRKGQMVDLAAVQRSIDHAVRQAEQMARVAVHTLFVGAGGPQARGLNSRGCIGVAREDRQITPQEEARALRAAENISLPAGRCILQALPQSFAVDDLKSVRNPLGMFASRLEAEVHLVTDTSHSLEHLEQALGPSRDPERFVFAPLAAGEAVLSPDERELGVLLLDIGAGKTSALLYVAGGPRFCYVLPVGGGHVTSDLAIGLNTTLEEAERLKREHGCVGTRELSKAERLRCLPVASMDGSEPRAVPRAHLGAIIECRMAEIFEIVQKELDKAGFHDEPRSGVVLTGGGALLPGCVEQAASTFSVPARLGRPVHLAPADQEMRCPSWAAAAGMLSLGLQFRRAEPSQPPAGGLRRWGRKIKAWFGDHL